MDQIILHFTLFVIVDDGDTVENGNYLDEGWSLYSSGGYNGDHKWVTKDQTDKKATWTYTVAIFQMVQYI